jgi:hypothetical protein
MNEPHLKYKGIYRKFKSELALGASMRMDSQVNSVSKIVVNVFEGVLDMWDGDFPNPGGIPDYRFRAGEPPAEVWINNQNNFVMTALAVTFDTKFVVYFCSEGC